MISLLPFSVLLCCCLRCSERMQLIATIDDPAVIQRVLAHLELPGCGQARRPVRRGGGASRAAGAPPR